jgi:hypothetical protein
MLPENPFCISFSITNQAKPLPTVHFIELIPCITEYRNNARFGESLMLTVFWGKTCAQKI